MVLPFLNVGMMATSIRNTSLNDRGALDDSLCPFLGCIVALIRQLSRLRLRNPQHIVEATPYAMQYTSL